jgi:excisionase family DNA binding protein
MTRGGAGTPGGVPESGAVVVLATSPAGLRLLRRVPFVSVLYVARSGQEPEAVSSPSHHPPVAQLWTYAEAGEWLGFSERHVRRLVAEGELRAVKSGRVTRIHRDDLLAFVERLRQEAS